jgi:small subunit ribosomal protein S21
MNKKQKYHQSILPGTTSGSKVVNRDINFALRMWKKKLKESDVLNDVKSRKEFIKPSVIKRMQLNNAVYMQQIRDLYID